MVPGDLRRHLLVAPLVTRLGDDLRDMRAVNPKNKTSKLRKNHYESRIDTMAYALGLVLGYDCHALCRAAFDAPEDEFDECFWKVVREAERRPVAPPRKLVRAFGDAIAHAFDQEVCIWRDPKIREWTQKEERHLAEVEVWAEVIDVVLRCGVTQVRRYAENAIRQAKPGPGFWDEYEQLVESMLGRPLADGVPSTRGR